MRYVGRNDLIISLNTDNQCFGAISNSVHNEKVSFRSKSIGIWYSIYYRILYIFDMDVDICS